MSTLFQTDTQRVQLYLAENAGWMKMLVAQKNELPQLEQLLQMENTMEVNYKTEIEKKLFVKELALQQEEMNKLNTALDQQQQRLKKDTEKKYLHDIDSLCNQDILRDKIKEIEKKYIELKCSFMKFLASII